MVHPSQRENLGIIVQYKVKVKLCLGALGGDLSAELPFVLMHPKPPEDPPASPLPPISRAIENNTTDDTNLIQFDGYGHLGWPSITIGGSTQSAPCHFRDGVDERIDGVDDLDDIIFEDFARLRLKAGETDAWGRSGVPGWTCVEVIGYFFNLIFTFEGSIGLFALSSVSKWTGNFFFKTFITMLPNVAIIRL